jgi:hypothetical protein
MPDWIDYLGSWDAATSSAEIQQDYEEYRQRMEAERARQQQIYAEHQQMMIVEIKKIDAEIKKAEELAEDKIKYPLFFWKENI